MGVLVQHYEAKARAGIADREFIDRLACGEHAAFSQLMQQCNQMLYRVARSIVRNEAEAEDVVQETYLIAFRSMKSFQGHSKLSTWLVRIAANEALGRVRRSARRAEITQLHGGAVAQLGEVPATELAEAPMSDAMRSQTRQLLEHEIDALPSVFRTVFILRALEEMSVAETAAALGIPESTVRTRFFRARSLLREALAQRLDLAYEDAFQFAGARCARISAAVVARLRIEA